MNAMLENDRFLSQFIFLMRIPFSLQRITKEH